MTGRRGRSVLQRLFDHIDQSAGPDACWPWTASRKSKGYGQVNVGGRPRLAHRVLYAELFGPIPAGKDLCHSCDNPPCCNSTHWFLGTHAENMGDMAAKGRAQQLSRAGEAHPRARLTWEQVRAIRARFGAGASKADLAREYAVTRTSIHWIVTNRQWREEAAA